MLSNTSTNTNNYISISIRNISFTVDCLSMMEASKIQDLIEEFDPNAKYKIERSSIWDDEEGDPFSFHFSYQEETQTVQYRKLIFRLKLEWPDMDFGEWGN